MKIAFAILLAFFLASVFSFIYVCRHERRSMWSGLTLVLAVFNLALLFVDILMMIDAQTPGQQEWILQLLVILLFLFLFAVLAFIVIMIVLFIYNGIKLLQKEGTRLTNFLSLGMGIAIITLIFVFPILASISVPAWVNALYVFISLTALYLIGLMLMYTLTSFINLINWFKPKLDYIVVLGAGLNGKKVTPLLASRVDRGIEIYRKNPGAKLIMTGGQGPREKIPEGQAMAVYAEKLGVPAMDIIVERKARNTDENLRFSHRLMKKNSRFCIVTSSYHVYRALVLAKRQGLQCIGYGAKTKWYFTLNAFIREFIACLLITKKMQGMIIGSFALVTVLTTVVYYLNV